MIRNIKEQRKKENEKEQKSIYLSSSTCIHGQFHLIGREHLN